MAKRFKKNSVRVLFLLVSFFLLLSVYFVIENRPIIFKTKEGPLLFKKEAVDKIVIVDNKRTTTITKKNNHWFVDRFPADEERIEAIINALAGLKREEIASRNKNSYPQFEVDGRRRVELANQTIYIGKNFTLNKSYFRLNKDANVYIAGQDLTGLLSSQEFRDLNPRFINNEGAISQLTLKWDDKKTSLKKEKNNWKTSSGKTLKREKVDFLINDIKTLRGDEIFNKKKIDLSKYPVDLTIIAREKEKEKKGFFYKKDEGKYYFYQQGADYIYQIPAAYVASLKKEEKDLF